VIGRGERNGDRKQQVAQNVANRAGISGRQRTVSRRNQTP
jgi:hypothetical protein